MNIKSALENWIYGILGFEERTFIVARRLTADVLNNDEAIITSTYEDYENLNRYTLHIIVTKQSMVSNVTVKPPTDEGIIGKLLKQYQCGYTGECDYKEEK